MTLLLLLTLFLLLPVLVVVVVAGTGMTGTGKEQGVNMRVLGGCRGTGDGAADADDCYGLHFHHDRHRIITLTIISRIVITIIFAITVTSEDDANFVFLL